MGVIGGLGLETGGRPSDLEAATSLAGAKVESSIGQADEVAVDGFCDRLHAPHDKGAEVARLRSPSTLSLLKTDGDICARHAPREVTFRGQANTRFQHIAAVTVIEDENHGTLEEPRFVNFEGNS